MEELDVPLEPLIRLFRTCDQFMIYFPKLLNVLETSVNNDISTKFNHFSEIVSSYRHVQTLDDNTVSQGTILSSIFSAHRNKNDSISSQTTIVDIFDRHNKKSLKVVGIVSHSKNDDHKTVLNTHINLTKKHRFRRWKNK